MPIKDKILSAAYGKEYRRKHGNVSSDSKERTRRKALSILGGKCIICGINDPIVLVIDHVYDDGARERKEYYAGYLPVAIIRGDIVKGRYQVLCHNCNWRKEFLRRKDAVSKRKTAANYGSGGTQPFIREEDGNSAESCH